MTYRDLAVRPVLTWSLVAVAARMPVAMAPLAVVFLVRERPGGYSLGALLAAGYVLGEIVGALLLGMRLRPERARRHMGAGLAVGAVGFAGLGLLPEAPAAMLAACAFLAGAAPAASAGGLRSLLTGRLVPRHAVAQALSVESMLMSGIWAVAPAAVTGLALAVTPRLPPLLAAVLLVAAAGGLWLLPEGWDVEEASGEGRAMLRLLAGAWPVYVTGAASIALLALAELLLPALLEQRAIGVGWSGPLLSGFALGSAVGAFLYGMRSWPGRLRTRSAVLMCGVSVCAVLVAVVPDTAGMAVALVAAGVLQAGAIITRNLALQRTLPSSALAAGYSVMYAAASAGYAVTGSAAGALLKVTTPDRAILAGVGFTLLLVALGAWGEGRAERRAARPDKASETLPGNASDGPSAASGGDGAPGVATTPEAVTAGPEGPAVRGGGDAERGL
ncbi:MFS transporter [Streptomyces sp. NPDC001595]|uniref:MFS transporter n=1 Tax=Streptomyces sp. NPDC001532 TaxID=3154520 RepID=UPI00331DB181